MTALAFLLGFAVLAALFCIIGQLQAIRAAVEQQTVDYSEALRDYHAKPFKETTA